MKYISNVFWITLFIFTFSNVAIAKSKKLDKQQWRESVNNRVGEVRDNCHKTKSYKLYVMAGKIQKDYQRVGYLKSLYIMQGVRTEKELQKKLKEDIKPLLKKYAEYKNLGGTLALSELKSANDPCEKKVTDELKKLSYIAPVDARLRHYVNPVYPRKHKIRRESGRVELEFIVDAKGKAKNIQVTSATSEAFSRSGKSALEASTFYASMKNGKPFAQRSRKQYYFHVK